MIIQHDASDLDIAEAVTRGPRELTVGAVIATNAGRQKPSIQLVEWQWFDANG